MVYDPKYRIQHNKALLQVVVNRSRSDNCVVISKKGWTKGLIIFDTLWIINKISQ